MQPTKIVKLLDELVQTYNQKGPEHFKDVLGIKTKTDGKHIIFDYNMIDVDWKWEPAHLCRGLVLDAHTHMPLCVPLVKFWNAGEALAQTIDWSSAVVFEKMDGTMVKRWYSPHTGEFELSTRYQLPGDLKQNTIGGSSITWHELISRCLKGIPKALNQSPQETLVFEVMSPINRVVVHHKQFHAALLARRSNVTMEEQMLVDNPFAPQTFAFASHSEVERFAHGLKGTQCEGFVVLDSNFNRVKIKGEQYVRLHHLKDSATSSLKSLILVVRNNEEDEVGTYFPEFVPAMEKIRDVIDEVVSQHVRAYEELKDIPERKDFALALQGLELPNPGLLFSVKANKFPSVAQAVQQMEDSKFLRFIKPHVEAAGINPITLEE